MSDYDDYDDDDENVQNNEPDWRNLTYEVFNPGHSVGVSCDRDGEVVGLHIDDEARDNGDTWLASEIVRIARLAHLKSRVGLRKEMEYRGTRPHTIDSFDLPTESGYRAMEEQELGTRVS